MAELMKIVKPYRITVRRLEPVSSNEADVLKHVSLNLVAAPF